MCVCVCVLKRKGGWKKLIGVIKLVENRDKQEKQYLWCVKFGGEREKSRKVEAGEKSGQQNRIYVEGGESNGC